jgi:hypothetical protein
VPAQTLVEPDAEGDEQEIATPSPEPIVPSTPVPEVLAPATSEPLPAPLGE